MKTFFWDSIAYFLPDCPAFCIGYCIDDSKKAAPFVGQPEVKDAYSRKKPASNGRQACFG